jgi:phosphate-selective porin
LRLKNKNADFEIGVNGYGQLDFASFRNWEDDEGVLANDDLEVPRFRIGIDGEWHRFSMEVQGEFADVVNFEDDEDVDRLLDAWLDYRFTKGLRLRVGNQKVPVSVEWLTSIRRVDFIKRSRLTDTLAPNRDVGAVLHGEVGRVDYEAGVFAGDGRGRRDQAETTAAAHVSLDLPRGLRVGGSFSQGDIQAEPDGPSLDPLSKGIQGEAFSGFEYFDRKFVNGRRRRLGTELAWVRGPASFKGEFLQLSEERLGQGPNFEDLPAVVARGWAVSTTWLITGEKKRAGIKPRRALGHGPGAIELALRAEEMRFDDEGDDTGFAGAGARSRNLRPTADRAFTAGISWWPVAEVRFLTNLVVERFRDPLLAPETGRRGNYVTLLARLQVELP